MSKKKKYVQKNKQYLQTKPDTKYPHNPSYCMIRPAVGEKSADDVSSANQS